LACAVTGGRTAGGALGLEAARMADERSVGCLRNGTVALVGVLLMWVGGCSGAHIGGGG
jgi:hypothetical protein